MTQTLSGELANGQRKLVALALAGANSELVNPLISQINNGPLGSFHYKASGGFRESNSDWSSGYGNIWSSAFLAIKMMLSLLNEPIYLRSNAHLKQLLNLLDVIIDNAENKKSSAPEESLAQMSTLNVDDVGGSGL